MKKELLGVGLGLGFVGAIAVIVYGLSTVILFYMVNLVIAPAFHLAQISWLQALALAFIYQLIQGLVVNAGKNR